MLLVSGVAGRFNEFIKFNKQVFEMILLRNHLHKENKSDLFLINFQIGSGLHGSSIIVHLFIYVSSTIFLWDN